MQHHGYNGEGGQLASHVRRKTPTIATLYAEADSNQAERTYSQLWEEADARDWEEGHSHEPPVRRRVPVAKAQGAAPSAPSRSSSISGWVGREYIPEDQDRGKGRASKGKWIPKSAGVSPKPVGTPQPKTPEGPPPPHHPRQPKTPPPNRDPVIGRTVSSIPAPPSTPPVVFHPPRPKSRPPPARTPPVPPLQGPHQDLLKTH